MREAVIVASSRTPLAKSFRGSFNLTRPDDMAAHCIRHVLGKTPQLDAAAFDLSALEDAEVAVCHRHFFVLPRREKTDPTVDSIQGERELGSFMDFIHK